MSALEQSLIPAPPIQTDTPPPDPWSDSEVLRIVRSDFETAENFRRNNHDPRWALADELYFGYEKQRYWKGTKIPRSSLGMFVVFQQVESMLPKVLSSIFADNPWFEAGPQPGTTARDAQDVRDLMLYQMELARRYQNQSVREVFRRAIKSGFLYGNGIVELYWMEQARKIRKLYRQEVPETVQLYGMPMQTGRTRQVIGAREIEKREQFPCLRNVSIKDFYIDPNCPGPQVQLARFVVKRALMTATEIKELASYDDRFRLPSDEELSKFCDQKTSTAGDSSKRWAEMSRGVDWSPEIDTSAAPGEHRAEVLCWYGGGGQRVVWTIGREWVFFNDVNDYGFIPFFNSFYTDAPDRFYGVSVADVTEGEHRLQGSVINARNDELALEIHGTTVKRRGFSIPQSQLSRKPGQVIETDNPKEDIVFRQTQNVTQQAFVEVAASELRVQKTTGITDLAVMGVQSSGGNSANRTAAGVGAQVQAAFSRLTYLVENIEDIFVEPILTGIHALNTLFLDPQRYIEIMNPAGKPSSVDPLAVLNADVIFTMRASSKMQSRMALIQQFPALAQALLNPGVMQALAAQGLTLDMGEFMQIFTDATSYAMRGTLIRPMSEQERAAFERSQNQQANLELQKQRERMKDIETDHESQRAADLTKEVAKIALTSALAPEDNSNAGA